MPVHWSWNSSGKSSSFDEFIVWNFFLSNEKLFFKKNFPQPTFLSKFILISNTHPQRRFQKLKANDLSLSDICSDLKIARLDFPLQSRDFQESSSAIAGWEEPGFHPGAQVPRGARWRCRRRARGAAAPWRFRVHPAMSSRPPPT